MVYKNKQRQIRDFVVISLIKGRIRPGDTFFEKKFFTSKFKVNPSYVEEVFHDLEKEDIIINNGESYLVSASNQKIAWLRDEFLHEYINDFVKNLADINVSLDEAIDILSQRNVANG